MSSFSLSDMNTESIPLSINIIEAIENDLEIYEIVSMAFLLYDDTLLNCLQNIKLLLASLNSDYHPKILSKWCQAQKSSFWKEKFIEALMIIQNYSILNQLGLDIEKYERQLNIKNLHDSHMVNLIRKALYYVIENLSESELIKIYDYAAAELTIKAISNESKYFEYTLLQMASENYINISQNPSLDKLLNKLYLIDRYDLAEYLENIIKTISSSNEDDNRSIIESIVSSTSYTKIVNDNQDEKYYPMKKDEVGYCLIINQKAFMEEINREYMDQLPEKALGTRYGTDIDRDRLSEVFCSFGFKVIYWTDLKHTEILQAIDEALNSKVSREDSCFVLCILSHGIEGAVYGSNCIPVEISDIERLLNGKKYPKILHMPKIIIIQACQGPRALDIVQNDLVEDGPELNEPRSCHILQFHSSIPGYASFRDELRGSWFIGALWECMLSAKPNSSFLDICTSINGEVQKKRAHRQDRFKAMVSTFNSTLSKILILPYIPQKRLKASNWILKRYLFNCLLEEYAERRVNNTDKVN